MIYFSDIRNFHSQCFGGFVPISVNSVIIYWSYSSSAPFSDAIFASLPYALCGQTTPVPSTIQQMVVIHNDRIKPP